MPRSNKRRKLSDSSAWSTDIDHSGGEHSATLVMLFKLFIEQSVQCVHANYGMIRNSFTVILYIDRAEHEKETKKQQQQ